MLRRELQELLGILRQDGYRTAAQLAELLGVSQKTVRIRLKELNDQLADYGAAIISKARYGYQLVIEDEEKYGRLAGDQEELRIPETERERQEYLLAYLLWHQEYIKSEDLCEFLYISRTTLSRSLKSVEVVLKRYSLALDRKPNYGIRVMGREIDIRRLISDYFIKRNCLEEMDNSRMERELVDLVNMIRPLLGRFEIRISETALMNFVDYVYVALKRMRSGNYLDMQIDSIPEMGVKEHAFIRELTACLSEWAGISYTKEEESYLLLYLAGKRMVGNVVENESNFIIHEYTDRLALSMLDVIKQSYHIDFRNNFEVRMTLNQHLVPFDIRIRFDIPLKNPLLEEIKENYCLAYQISCEAVQVLRRFYHKEISEDEIGYFALIFELAMEKEQVGGEACDILVVSSSGKGSSRLLKYKYEHEFADYLNHIYVCDLLELERFDFSKVDYVFTTFPITIKIPVPIVEVGVFLGEDDIRKVTDILRRGNADYLKHYYSPERFFTGVQAETKEEVLAYLCGIIARQEEVDEDFYELVLEREEYVQMDYGNHIAIPHPNRIASVDTFAYVAVLEQPIFWDKRLVQVVILTSVGTKEDKNRQKFYEATARFALNASAVERLIEKPEYEIFLELLQE